MGIRDPEKYRNRLRQLKGLQGKSEEEIEAYIDSNIQEKFKNEEFEDRIQGKLKEFENDYDISNLKANDKMVLRGLIQALISLEDYEKYASVLQRKITTGDYDDTIMQRLEKINKFMDTLRVSISRYQDDLKISRKIRQSDQESSLSDYIVSLKERSKKFYESRVARVFCPKCKTLIGTVWALYPEDSKNKFYFYCKKCDEKTVVYYKDLVKSNMRNIDDVLEF